MPTLSSYRLYCFPILDVLKRLKKTPAKRQLCLLLMTILHFKQIYFTRLTFLTASSHKGNEMLSINSAFTSKCFLEGIWTSKHNGYESYIPCISWVTAKKPAFSPYFIKVSFKGLVHLLCTINLWLFPEKMTLSYLVVQKDFPTSQHRAGTRVKTE